MSAGGYLDGCGFIPVSTGTVDFVVLAAVQGYQTPASAGAVNATVYTYRAESADKSQWEIGFGAYTIGTTTLARSTVLASSTGSKVSFTAPPNVYVTAAKADLQNAALLTGGTVAAARLGSGTPDTTTLLRGDGAWTQMPYVRAAAWFVGSASNGAQTLDASFNITSVVRTASGVYTVNFTTALPDTNYYVTFSTDSRSSANGWGQMNTVSVAKSTTAFGTSFVTSNAAQYDPPQAYIVVHR